jgi:hypothetical protein
VAPPVAPSPVAPPPGYPAQPPGYPAQPQYSPQPAYPQPPLQPQPQPAEAPKKKRTGLVVALLVALLFLAGIAAAVLLLALAGGSDLSTTLDTCRIEADGTMVATGEATSGDGAADATVTVLFTDDADGSEIETVTADVDVPDGGSAPWEAEGSAGDDVQRIGCEVTEIEGG